MRSCVLVLLEFLCSLCVAGIFDDFVSCSVAIRNFRQCHWDVLVLSCCRCIHLCSCGRGCLGHFRYADRSGPAISGVLDPVRLSFFGDFNDLVRLRNLRTCFVSVLHCNTYPVSNLKRRRGSV